MTRKKQVRKSPSPRADVPMRVCKKCYKCHRPPIGDESFLCRKCFLETLDSDDDDDQAGGPTQGYLPFM